jgi:SAM-dependent methyltransferase
VGSPITRSRRSTAATNERDTRSDGRIGDVNTAPALASTATLDAVVGGFDYETIPDGYYDLAYRRRRGIQSKWHHLKFTRVAEEMEGHRRHLDVGCGPGTLIGLLDDPFSSTGVDISRTQIAYARREYESESKRFFALPVRALPDDCRDYDVATVVEVIEHLSPDDVDDLLGATIERLRPDGKLVVTTPNFHSAWRLVQVLVNRFGDVHYTPQHINHYTPLRLGQLLHDLGLKDVRVQPFLALAPFTAPLGWQLPDLLARLERGPVEELAGLLLLGTGIKAGVPRPTRALSGELART